MTMNYIFSLSSFNLFFFTQVLSVLTSAFKYSTHVTDKGKNVSIQCQSDGNIVWIKDDAKNPKIIQTGKLLMLTNVTTADSGLYVCFSFTSDENTLLISNNNSISLSSNKHKSLVFKQEENQLDLFGNNSSSENKNFLALANDSQDYLAIEKINVTVRSTPGPVTKLFFKASTILGFLIWKYDKARSGGYPIRSFTAEFRTTSNSENPVKNNMDNDWILLDPKNIAPNVRQMEVYRLEANTTYEFRIWANNVLGKGDIVTTNVTTLPEFQEDDLIRLIKPDLDKFDPRIWIVAVSIVLGTLVILAIGLCIILSKECYQSSNIEFEDGWESIELIPNIILNPGFSETEKPPFFSRTIVFDDDDSSGADVESDHEPAMEKFKRKVSVFFTGPTIKRI